MLNQINKESKTSAYATNVVEVEPLLRLANFEDVPRWVTWREEERDGERTKVPYDPKSGHRAKSNDPQTWATRRRAQRRCVQMNGDGAGFVLGKLNNGDWAIGIDIDLGGLRNPKNGGFEPLAHEVVKRFDTYTEISPSRQGVKLFFIVSAKDAERVDALMEGKTRRTFGAGKHREIALDRGRYYAVTDEHFKGTRTDLRTVSAADIEWLLTDAGPRFQAEFGQSRQQNEQQNHSRDETDSGYGFRFMSECKRLGYSYEEAVAATKADAGIAGDWARRVDIQRAWDNAIVINRHGWDDPLLDDRRGELPDFPVDAMYPISLRKWLRRAARGAGTMVDYVAVPLLGIASSLIGTQRRVRASTAFVQPATCWTSVVGFSGSGKTPGLGMIRKPLDEVEVRRKNEVDDLRREHDTRMEQAKAAAKKWKKAMDEAVEQGRARPPKPQEADEPEPFIAPRLYVTDVTIERMTQLIQARPSGMLLVFDELAGWFQNMSRYSGGTDNQFHLMSWDGNSYKLERVGRPSLELNHLLVGVVGGLQPDKLADCFQRAADGMYARFLMAWPPQAPYRPLTDTVEEIDVNMITMLDRLASLPPRQAKHNKIGLDKDALNAFEQIRKKVHAEMDSLDGRERDWWSKVPAHVLRLALTLAYLWWARESLKNEDEPEPDEIQKGDIEAAGQLVLDYFWPHARACLRQIGLSERQANERRVLRWIKAKQLAEIKREEIRRGPLHRTLNADEVETLLQNLVHAGWLRRKSTPTKGRPVVAWQVNPRLAMEE